MRTWLITGASTGLGRALAEAVLEKGDQAVVTARSPGSVMHLADQFPDTALALGLDVTDHHQVQTAISQATERFGGVDVLVNNAGYGFRSAVEEAGDDEVAKLFDTNFFGPVELIKQVLPQMRDRRAGTIINVSSIGAPRSNPGSGYYTATKAALEGVSDALQREVGPLGIRVIIIEPGAFRTEFSGRSLQQSRTAIEDYAETAHRRRKENDRTHGTQPGDPAGAASAIIEATESKEPPLRLLLGTDALDIVRAEYQSRLEEIQHWEHLSVTTDFPADSSDQLSTLSPNE